MSTSATNRFQQVRQAIRQSVQRYASMLQHPTEVDQQSQKAAVQDGISALSALEARLVQPVLRVAVFGLVSRGKSAVINALVGEDILPTGPLHGVTRWPRSLYWRPQIEAV
ncbi:MAG: dynamin family protein, partial [Cyanobacteria bacterium P01_H01_bin.153]